MKSFALGALVLLAAFSLTPSAHADPVSITLEALTSGPPETLTIAIQDATEGLAGITIDTAVNVSLLLPPFALGTTAEIPIVVTVVNPSLPFDFALTVKDTIGDSTFANFNNSSMPIPEPGSLILLTTGLAGAMSMRRRRMDRL